jgi:FkbM family methyltransferase
MLPPTVARAILFSGQHLDVVLPEKVGIEIYRYGFIEADLTHLLLERLEPGATFVDVGSHYGYYSVLASPVVGNRGGVFAFEPSRKTFRLLEANTRSMPNVRREQVAVYSRPGLTRIRDFGVSNSALNTLQSQARVPASDRPRSSDDYDVPCVRLDDYFESQEKQPDFVKIDAESVELDVLMGMERLLRERNLFLTVEVGDYDVDGAPRSSACISFLTQRGYGCFEYRDGALHPHEPRASYEYANLYYMKV